MHDRGLLCYSCPPSEASLHLAANCSSICTTIADETEQKHGFPGVCGFIDGTHIPVKPPLSWDRDSYINRKGFPSVNVLAVCDHEMLFTYVYADRAGSVHDARVLRVSTLGQTLESNSWPSGDNLHVLVTLRIRCCYTCWSHIRTTSAT